MFREPGFPPYAGTPVFRGGNFDVDRNVYARIYGSSFGMGDVENFHTGRNQQGESYECQVFLITFHFQCILFVLTIYYGKQLVFVFVRRGSQLERKCDEFVARYVADYLSGGFQAYFVRAFARVDFPIDIRVAACHYVERSSRFGKVSFDGLPFS